MTPLHTALLAVLGAQGVTDDPAALALAGSDILTSANAVPPSLVLRPRTTAAAAAAMRVLADAGVCVVPRGAGLSYTLRGSHKCGTTFSRFLAVILSP